MTSYQRNFAFSEAGNYKDIDAFVSDMLLSSEFLPDDTSILPDTSLIEPLKTIWKVANLPFKDYLDLLKRTQTGFSRRFNIPARTVRGWALEERTCPPYLRLMAAEIDGLFEPEAAEYTFVDEDCRRYMYHCKAFAKDTAGWDALDPHKFYTTNTSGWEESSDNACGGLDVSWAFHMPEDLIEYLAPQYLVRNILTILDTGTSDEWSSEQFEKTILDAVNVL